MDSKVILAALGLPEGATIEQITDFAVAKAKAERSLSSVLAAVGVATEAEVSPKVTQLKSSAEGPGKLLALLNVKSTDEALGVVTALQANRDQVDGEGYTAVMGALGAQSSEQALGIIAAYRSATERLTVAESELSALRNDREKTEREEIVAKLEAEGKITPAQKEQLIPTLQSLASLKAFAATAVPILKGDGKREPKSAAQKPYSEMSNTERAELHASDPELFRQLRAQAQQDGAV